MYDANRKTRPSLIIAPAVWERIITYAECASPNEIGGYGIVDWTGSEFFVSEVFIFEQTVSPGSVQYDATNECRFITEFMRRGGDPNRIRLEWHSHGRGAAYHSFIDTRNLDKYDCDWLVSLVVNADGERVATFELYNPGRLTVDMAVKVRVPRDEAMVVACKKEIADKVRVASGKTDKPIGQKGRDFVEGLFGPNGVLRPQKTSTQVLRNRHGDDWDGGIF